MTRIGIFGWGVIAPRSPNVEAFERNLASGESWLSAFSGFGPSNFLVGDPEFRFEDYRPWIDERFPPSRYAQLTDKMDPTALQAIGAYIQATTQNPGIEQELQGLGLATHAYVGSGLGNLPTLYKTSVELHKSQKRWDRFWTHPERNPALKAWLDQDAAGRARTAGVPPEPATLDAHEREDAEEAWNHYWAGRSSLIHEYLDDLRKAESVDVTGDVEKNKLNVLRHKAQRIAKLQEKWGAPEPPWRCVSANILWNISNTPAAQVTMIGKITGFSFAPVAACSTFGVALKLGCDAIRRGEAKAVVVGASDPPPHPLSVGAFYAGRVISADSALSKPLSGLRGTHVGGGSCVWIIGDMDHFKSRGFKPLGMEPIAVGVTSDAHHIITPTKEGPLAAIRSALAEAGARPEDIGTWDLHATATPGDYLEVENLRDVLPGSVLVSARKGIFGHGMSACGGWELTAQYLGFARGRLFPTPLSEQELNQEIARVHRNFIFDAPVLPPKGLAGKLSMGVGGINACVISRPLAP